MRRRQFLGQWGERLAAWWLERQGYDLVTANYHCPGGELDLVMRRHGQLAFFEVKTRRTLEHGAPEEAFDRRKQYRCQKAIDHYLARYAPDAETWQVGLVAITRQPNGGALVRLIWY